MPTSTTFALSPFLLTAATANVIDYTTKAGKELYTKATESLDSNEFKTSAYPYLIYWLSEPQVWAGTATGGA